ncbi:MAG: hypothetical protein ACPGUD_04955 [Parashewanella sp.]
MEIIKSELDMQAAKLCITQTLLFSVNCFANFLTPHSAISENNFAQFHSGQEYCDYQMAYDPNIKACMPIYNENSHTSISTQLKEGDPSQTIAPGNILPSYFFDDTESFNIIIKNLDSNKTIYKGPVYTIEGLACDYNSCAPWN